MPFDANGNHSLPDGTIVSTGDKVLPSQHNPAMNDLSASLSAVLKKDGRDGMVGTLDMGSFPISNVGAGSNSTDAATVGQVQSAMPIGVVLDYAGATVPPGWLLCYGQAISRATYAALFAAIGTTYGAGDGSTTFNVPDCRDVVIVGRGNMGGTASGLLSKFASTTLGALFGVQEHALTTAQLASHSHTGATSSAGAHSHTLTLPRGDENFNNGSGNGVWGPSANRAWTTSSDGAHTHSFTTATSGSGAAHPNVQPSLVMNKIIRATY